MYINNENNAYIYVYINNENAIYIYIFMNSLIFKSIRRSSFDHLMDVFITIEPNRINPSRRDAEARCERLTAR